MFEVIILLNISFLPLISSNLLNFPPVTVLLYIYDLLKLYKLSYPILAHIPPYDKIISFSMLNYGYGGLIRKLFIFLFSGINPLI